MNSGMDIHSTVGAIECILEDTTACSHEMYSFYTLFYRMCISPITVFVYRLFHEDFSPIIGTNFIIVLFTDSKYIQYMGGLLNTLSMYYPEFTAICEENNAHIWEKQSKVASDILKSFVI